MIPPVSFDFQRGPTRSPWRSLGKAACLECSFSLSLVDGRDRWLKAEATGKGAIGVAGPGIFERPGRRRHRRSREFDELVDRRRRVINDVDDASVYCAG